MARTKSTARKSGGGGRGGCNSSRGSRRSLHPAQEVDFLALFANWLVALISKFVTHLVESDALWLEWFPFLSSLCVSKAPQNEVIRTISASPNCTGEQETNNHNLLLQEAVSAFITKDFTFETSKMFYDLEEDPGSKVSSNEYGDDDSYPSASLTPKLARPNSQWLKLTPEIDFKYVTAGLDIYYQFRSSHPSGSDKIDAFITNAFELHQELEAQRVKEEKERYHFERLENGSSKPRAVRSSGRGIRGRGRRRAQRRRTAAQPQSMQVCKRYRLTDVTTFASLFFEGKTQLIQTLDDFHRRVGKFAPRKFAHRMGIFLHGPSETGKTGIAKAVAHHTNRHLMNVQASQIKTNKEMADLLQDFNYSVPSLGITVELDFKDVVVVLEGVDEIRFAADSKSQVSRRSLFTGFPTIDSEEEADALTVHGFLSALDGMVDTPGRMIVMTASSKDRVAPGLLRPGRVHATLDLGTMTSKCAQEMVEHYLDTKLDTEQVGTLQSMFHGEAAIGALLAPVEMEAICLESQDVDSVLRELSSFTQ